VKSSLISVIILCAAVGCTGLPIQESEAIQRALTSGGIVTLPATGFGDTE